MRRALLGTLSCLCITTVGAIGCNSPGDPGVSADRTNLTLHLSANSDGDLEICGDDASFIDPLATAEQSEPANHALADSQCQQMPNPCGCATGEIDINSETGATSDFRCLDDTGALTAESCDINPVICTVFAAPEPDCVVCAILDGAVIFSSCIPSAPDPTRCELLVGCEICFASDGDVISTTCQPNCDTVLCALIPCPPDTRSQILPGDCCPTCVPINYCDGVLCPELALVDCPDGQLLHRAADDCCSYYCEPDDCSAYVGATAGDPTGSDSTTIASCPPGTTWVVEAPACGQCVPTDPDRYCTVDDDCAGDQFCSYEAGVCQLPPECEFQACPAVCYGVCRQEVCTTATSSTGTDPSYIPTAYCEGDLITEIGLDGCPTIRCLCPNGDLSLDGTCWVDDCSLVMCPAILCPEGTVADYTNSCCGDCVPLGCGSECPDPADVNVTYMSTDPNICPLLDYACAADQDPFFSECGCGCLTRYDPTGSDGTTSSPAYACPQILCAPGWHVEPDPAGCCDICVPDLCMSSQDCAFSDYCTTEDGVCESLPCDDSSGAGCNSLADCYGTCAPRSQCEDSDGVDPSTPGTATTTIAGVTETRADQCSSDGGSVIEIICLTDGTLWESVLNCRNGCQDGACLP